MWLYMFKSQLVSVTKKVVTKGQGDHFWILYKWGLL